MHVELEDYQTGWVGLRIGLTTKDIDSLISLLTTLKDQSSQHFHISNKFEEQIGLADIEFYLQETDSANMWLSGPAIEATR